MTHGLDDPHASDLKKIDAILTDIRTRLVEPEPEPKPDSARTGKLHCR